MSIGRICNRSVVVISPDESLREAARRMSQYNVGTLVIVDGNNVPTGIVSDRDLVVRCLAPGRDPDAMTVEEVMTTPVRRLPEETPIEDALSTMASLGVRRLPVVDRDERLAGLLSVDDVLELLTEEAESIGKLLVRYAPDIPEH